MNILFFAHEAQLYGSNRSLLNFITELKKLNTACFVILPQKGPLCDELEKLQIGYEIIKYYWWVSSPNITFWRQPMQFIKRLRTSLAKVRFTIKQLPKIKKTALSFNTDIVYSNSSVIWVGWVMARIIKKPHVWHIREFKDLDHNLYPDFGNWFFKKILSRSDQLIFISNALKQHVFPKSDSNLSIIPNPVGSVSEFEIYKNQNGTDEKIFHFLIIGSIQKGKGQEDAVWALYEVRKEIKDVRLLIAGKGDQTGLRELVQQLNLEDVVEFLGHIDDPHSAYAKANAVLMCSKNEAFGRVTAEAMMHSLPVIGYNNGGTREIIIDNRTGYLYDSIEDLIKKMKESAKNAVRSRELGVSGWRHAKKHFTSEVCARAIYEQIVMLQK